jgi:hypothetical protein
MRITFLTSFLVAFGHISPSLVGGTKVEQDSISRMRAHFARRQKASKDKLADLVAELETKNRERHEAALVGLSEMKLRLDEKLARFRQESEVKLEDARVKCEEALMRNRVKMQEEIAKVSERKKRADLNEQEKESALIYAGEFFNNVENDLSC